ncbi:MAG: hypothetical protein WKF73_03120 [Nocardioidaceae bacterium]
MLALRPCDVTDGPAGMVAHVNGAVVQRKGSGALGKAGISLHWYRRTGATVIARGMGTDAAATFLGHSSTAITEGHYIEPDRTVDPTPATHLERTLRPDQPDGALLTMVPAEGEDEILSIDDDDPDAGAVA